jgi:glutaconate CoA-transferase subunit B
LTLAAKSEVTARGYTAVEIMVAVAARQIRDGEFVFVGMRLPLLGFLVAKRTHAPHAVALYENGVLRDAPAAEMLYTMGDGPNLRGATMCGSMLDMMGFLQQGRVNVGFLGAAEVDRFGNLNTIWGRRGGNEIRLPGSGGACDIACLAQRTVILMAHERHRFVERVAHVTSPGFGTGNDWRRARGLPAKSGPSAIVTTLGVLCFSDDGEAYLASVHPGVAVEDVLAATGWSLRVDDALTETAAPSKDELAAIRTLDPKGFWTR